MKVLDWILIGLGLTAVIIYLILKLRENQRYKKIYQEQIDKGLTPIQAKENTDKFFAKPKKEKAKQEDEDEEEIWKE